MRPACLLFLLGKLLLSSLKDLDPEVLESLEKDFSEYFCKIKQLCLLQPQIRIDTSVFVQLYESHRPYVMQSLNPEANKNNKNTKVWSLIIAADLYGAVIPAALIIYLPLPFPNQDSPYMEFQLCTLRKIFMSFYLLEG